MTMMLLLIRTLLVLCFAANATGKVGEYTFTPGTQGDMFTPGPLCNGIQTVQASQQRNAMSVGWNGTFATAVFLRADNGSVVRIDVDDVFQGNVDLFDPSSSSTACNTISWTSGALSNGPHSMMVSHFGSSAVVGAPSASTMYLLKIQYNIPDDPSLSSYISSSSTIASSPPTLVSTLTLVSISTSFVSPSVESPSEVLPSPKSSNAGAIAGGVAGGVVAIVAVTFLLWWLRKRRTHYNHTNQMNSGLHEDDKPTQSSWPAAGEALNELPIQPPTPYQDTPIPSSPQRSEVPTPWSPSTNPGSTIYGGASTYTTVSPPSPTITPPNRTASPVYSMPNSVGNRLSRHQLDLVQNLAAQNVPGPTIAAIVDSMLADPNYNPTTREPEVAPAYREVK